MRSYRSQLWSKKYRSYRGAPIDEERRKNLEGAMSALYESIGLFDRCWVCEELIDSPKRQNGWYIKARKRFGSLARRCYQKSGKLGYPKSRRYVLAFVDGEVWNVPVCCDGCQKLAQTFYEEKKEWLLQAHGWLEKAREQLTGLKKFLKTGDREVLKSLQAESRQAATLPL